MRRVQKVRMVGVLVLVGLLLGIWKFGMPFGVVTVFYIIAIEIVNYHVSVVRKTYKLYLNGKIESIGLSSSGKIVERWLLSDERRKVDNADKAKSV